MSIVALIPARGGSKRIPNKNVKLLAGKPLLAYTIAAAHHSGVFDALWVSTDDPEIKQVAIDYAAPVVNRPAEFAADDSPDIDWLAHLAKLGLLARYDAFAILRPTSPFRRAETIRRAWAKWQEYDKHFDSMRAVEPVKQHPCKMWWGGAVMTLQPYCESVFPSGVPHHSSPTQKLPRLLVQNASLEIAWTKTLTEQHSISGTRIMPFLTTWYEGIDLNTPEDWLFAEFLVEKGLAQLPEMP